MSEERNPTRNLRYKTFPGRSVELKDGEGAALVATPLFEDEWPEAVTLSYHAETDVAPVRIRHVNEVNHRCYFVNWVLAQKVQDIYGNNDVATSIYLHLLRHAVLPTMRAYAPNSTCGDDLPTWQTLYSKGRVLTDNGRRLADRVDASFSPEPGRYGTAHKGGFLIFGSHRYSSDGQLAQQSDMNVLLSRPASAIDNDDDDIYQAMVDRVLNRTIDAYWDTPLNKEPVTVSLKAEVTIRTPLCVPQMPPPFFPDS